jgi:ribose 1,5-bisphosphokinase PhnN
MIFDTLAYPQRLKASGFTEAQAETLAEASREMLADGMVTRSFLQSELVRIKARIDAAADRLQAEFRAEIKDMEMRLTLRLGVVAVAVVAALAAIIKL